MGVDGHFCKRYVIEMLLKARLFCNVSIDGQMSLQRIYLWNCIIAKETLTMIMTEITFSSKHQHVLSLVVGGT